MLYKRVAVGLIIFCAILCGWAVGWADDLVTPVLPPLGPLEETATEIEPDRFYVEFIRMLSLLGILLAAFLIVAWFFKKMMGKKIDQMNAASQIKIVERRTLSPKTSIFMIEVEGKRMILAESHSGVTLIGELAPPRPGSFQEVLDRE